jgi:hypothetical protein
MLFPKNRMRFATSYQGRSEPDGWIMLDLAGVDMDGVNRIYVSVADVQKLREGGDTATDRLKQARALLGGDPDEP